MPRKSYPFPPPCLLLFILKFLFLFSPWFSNLAAHQCHLGAFTTTNAEVPPSKFAQAKARCKIRASDSISSSFSQARFKTAVTQLNREGEVAPPESLNFIGPETVGPLPAVEPGKHLPRDSGLRPPGGARAPPVTRRKRVLPTQVASFLPGFRVPPVGEREASADPQPRRVPSVRPRQGAGLPCGPRGCEMWG